MILAKGEREVDCYDDSALHLTVCSSRAACALRSSNSLAC
jgi:hypothetical protein